jgi:hypothetical protein
MIEEVNGLSYLRRTPYFRTCHEIVEKRIARGDLACILHLGAVIKHWSETWHDYESLIVSLFRRQVEGYRLYLVLKFMNKLRMVMSNLHSMYNE